MWAEQILHVDMDSFFVEVERLEDERLRGKPVAVGGTAPRGVVASASYEARRRGVHSAQPTATALRLCPELVVVPAAHHKYAEMSVRVFEILRSITPQVEGLSVDEAFLDVGGLRLHYESPQRVAEEVRSRIRGQIGLPASVGIGTSKLVAKLASESAKPDGVRLITRDTQLAFLHALPASSLPGVGPATMAALTRLGVETVGEVADLPSPTLSNAVGPSAATYLLDVSSGIDRRQVTPDSESKSISVEETYDRDLESRELVETALLAHAHRLSSRLRRSGVTARTVTLKLRRPDFETITRSETVDIGLDGARELFAAALRLLAEIELSRGVRLLGLGGSSLHAGGEPRQISMEASEEWSRVEDAIDLVRRRFGDEAITAARLLGEGVGGGEPVS